MNRPDPDQLLDLLQRNEARRRRGKLKLFFGASAGVGKTYAMLQAARQRQREGTDVVAGIVETHGRAETAALLAGLECMPRRLAAQDGGSSGELDLDAVLARRPALALIDELAHSNVANSRHRKRWQDVEELLDAGIDVYATLNVQHLESLNDVVGGITQIRVNETVPDRIFEQADEIALVDLPVEELLERFRHGKVYVPAQAERAMQHFFRPGNLIALRELALRRTADRVDAQMREYRADRGIDRVWQAHDRVMVCIGPGANGNALVRSAARLAAGLRCDWLAVHVQTPRQERRADAARAQPLAALKLAGEMGAESVTLAGVDAVATLLDYAKARNVNRLVVGASRRHPWRRAFEQRLAGGTDGLDVTIVRPREMTRASIAAPPPALPKPRSGVRAYLWACGVWAAVTALASVVEAHFDLSNLVMLYLLGVVFSAARLGRGPGILQSLLGVAAFDFFFVPPRLSFTIADTQYLLTFVVLLATSLLISHLTANLQAEARFAREREKRSAALYALSGELGAALETEQIVAVGIRHVAEVFAARALILLPDGSDRIRQTLDLAEPGVRAWAPPPDALDVDIAQWVYDQEKPAGQGTDTLPASVMRYIPLKAPMRTRGVLALQLRSSDLLAVPEQKRMLDTFAAQIALALERVHYSAIARDALVSMESERLRNTVLSAVSHDLRTPLTAIVGLATMLAGSVQTGDAHARVALTDAIRDEAERMNGIVTNLLDMARLQAGDLRANRQWVLLDEIIGTALRAGRRQLGKRAVRVSLPHDLPLLRLDAVLLERVFANLFENFAKYTPDGATLQINAARQETTTGDEVRVTLADDGPGLPVAGDAQSAPGTASTMSPPDRDTSGAARLFEKFARGQAESAIPGIGLGLAICRAIVEAHGGRIGACNRERADGSVAGAMFWLTLPVASVPPMAPAIEGELA
ncbi:sensor histidine kinase [Chitinasiproducens palmae]|uniref:histidine kinase n=1 Tax=Chitinasiproducens palmae TaxID=1770053 RepID=A0A1H2PKU7_9BURK|nr:sensor histidine kinase KdpD [Chitinasiproducens palmae]SDV47085.1 osmosensitive K+ channel signal transduction histidine kinase [Chitinasiproducens palmae]